MTNETPDNQSSLLWLRDADSVRTVTSTYTDDGEDSDKRFDFDQLIMCSKIYTTAFGSLLQAQLSAEKRRKDTVTDADSSASDAVDLISTSSSGDPPASKTEVVLPLRESNKNKTLPMTPSHESKQYPEDKPFRDQTDGDDSTDESMSSSPICEDIDIDFELTYALHTFVATVEGQINVSKGDILVLLDDSNPYWWLVRRKEHRSSADVGYLPAEFVEMPTERLARLNTHRNCDLVASIQACGFVRATRAPRMRSKQQKTTFVDEIAIIGYSTTYELSESDKEQT